MNPTVAVYDACVLFPPSLRDFLVWLGVVGACRPRWSDMIHEEWIRNVLARRSDLQKPQLERCRQLMDANIPDSLIAGFEALIPTIELPDENDRHVVAAAIHGGADCIVTFNLKDFPTSVLSTFQIEVVHPDDFMIRLMDTSLV